MLRNHWIGSFQDACLAYTRPSSTGYRFYDKPFAQGGKIFQLTADTDITYIAQDNIRATINSNGCTNLAQKTMIKFIDEDSKCPPINLPIDLGHIFFDCLRIKAFWKLISERINTSKESGMGIVTGVSKEDVFDKLQRYKKLLPVVGNLHALTIWEIYRARTETNLSRVRTETTGIYNRWLTQANHFLRK
ncbi:hypothetical protein BB558_003165 [Smittium angustum]|uniref:Uncharacterized protein n=2 Tax=Harpellales TaxID=61421 RepID=A0A2U1J6R9_SMIAN|nr:hypothetical protein BB558_003165 [Smittium angustum]